MSPDFLFADNQGSWSSVQTQESPSHSILFAEVEWCKKYRKFLGFFFFLMGSKCIFVIVYFYKDCITALSSERTF